MKISVITPNYNYDEFISQTIESVLNQDYKNIEYVIVDDGSTDNSVKIIKHYQNNNPHIIKLIEQTNKGQTNALNVALSQVTGDIICWINSDDMFCANVFSYIANEFNRDKSIYAIYGDIYIIDMYNNIIKLNKYLSFSYISAVFNGFGKEIPSNGIFWRNKNKIFFDESFDFAMDSEYWSRLLINKKIKKINIPIAKFRWHENAKTIKSKNYNDKGYRKALEERQQIFRTSYSNLLISKYIPIKYSKPIYYFFRFRRLFLRGVKGEYFKRNRL